MYTAKVVVSRKWCKIGLQTLLATNKKWYTIYQVAEIPMTSSVLEGHSPYKPFKWSFSYSCAPVDKISTDMARRAVPPQ